MKNYPVSEEAANSPGFWGMVCVGALLMVFVCLILVGFMPNVIL